MKLTVNQESLLDRGGHPTVRELLSKLTYNPVDGTIKLNERRLIMQRATSRGALRDELIGQYGREDAQIILTRLGYLAGQEDAEFIRQAWPALEQGDAFTAGTRLHMLKGEVRVETVHNDFDFRKGKFSAEFFWNDSAEATEYLDRHNTAHEPMCWTQIAYAAGYASFFFDKLIVYKEVECIARGDKRCRVVGRTAEKWGDNDETVQFYRRHILADGKRPTLQPHKLRPATIPQSVAGGGDHLGDPVDAILLEPVRQRLEQILDVPGIPVLITGPCGSGKCVVARHIHRHEAAYGAVGSFERISCAEVAQAGVPGILDVQARRGRRSAPREEARRTIVLEDIERLSEAAQRYISGLLAEDGTVSDRGLRPRIIAMSTLSPRELMDLTHLRRDFLFGFMAQSIAMPALATRPHDVIRLANAILGRLAARFSRSPRTLTNDAATWIATLPLHGNLLELKSLLGGAVLSEDQDLITASTLRAVAQRMEIQTSQSGALHPILTAALERAIEEDNFVIDNLNREIHQIAIRSAQGNVAKAARMLGLSRAQFAYRLGQTGSAEGD